MTIRAYERSFAADANRLTALLGRHPAAGLHVECDPALTFPGAEVRIRGEFTQLGRFVATYLRNHDGRGRDDLTFQLHRLTSDHPFASAMLLTAVAQAVAGRQAQPTTYSATLSLELTDPATLAALVDTAAEFIATS